MATLAMCPQKLGHHPRYECALYGCGFYLGVIVRQKLITDTVDHDALLQSDEDGSRRTPQTPHGRPEASPRSRRTSGETLRSVTVDQPVRDAADHDPTATEVDRASAVDEAQDAESDKGSDGSSEPSVTNADAALRRDSGTRSSGPDSSDGSNAAQSQDDEPKQVEMEAVSTEGTSESEGPHDHAEARATLTADSRPAATSQGATSDKTRACLAPPWRFPP